MTNPFLIEPLTPEHPRQGFSSGDAALDRYLHEFFERDSQPQCNDCFVALDDRGIIAGFYTLAAASLSLGDLPEGERASLPRDAIIPAKRIGRLAVDRGYCGQGLGGALVMDAAFRSVQVEPLIFVLMADANNPTAVQIYEHLGFRRFESCAETLFIPIETVLKAARVPRASVVPSSRR